MESTIIPTPKSKFNHFYWNCKPIFRYEGESYDLRKDIPELYKNNVRFVGGCCTVGPETIKNYKDFIIDWDYKSE